MSTTTPRKSAQMVTAEGCQSFAGSPVCRAPCARAFQFLELPLQFLVLPAAAVLLRLRPSVGASGYRFIDSIGSCPLLFHCSSLRS